MGSALISTPWSIRSASKPGPTKAGIVVLKVFAVFGWALRDAPSRAGGECPPDAALSFAGGG